MALSHFTADPLPLPLRALLGPILIGVTLLPGFAVHDLTTLPVEPATLLGAGYIARAEPSRLTAVCASCEGEPMVDVRIGRQDDGTEGRIRAGTTTIAQLEALCQQRDPACRLESVSVAPAVGWMSTYRFGTQYAHTIVVLRDGDLLTIRVLSANAALSRKNADLLVAKVVPVVVGS